jgi:hypothetical protein
LRKAGRALFAHWLTANWILTARHAKQLGTKTTRNRPSNSRGQRRKRKRRHQRSRPRRSDTGRRMIRRGAPRRRRQFAWLQAKLKQSDVLPALLPHQRRTVGHGFSAAGATGSHWKRRSPSPSWPRATSDAAPDVWRRNGVRALQHRIAAQAPTRFPLSSNQLTLPRRVLAHAAAATRRCRRSCILPVRCWSNGARLSRLTDWSRVDR